MDTQRTRQGGEQVGPEREKLQVQLDNENLLRLGHALKECDSSGFQKKWEPLLPARMRSLGVTPLDIPFFVFEAIEFDEDEDSEDEEAGHVISGRQYLDGSCWYEDGVTCTAESEDGPCRPETLLEFATRQGLASVAVLQGQGRREEKQMREGLPEPEPRDEVAGRPETMASYGGAGAWEAMRARREEKEMRGRGGTLAPPPLPTRATAPAPRLGQPRSAAEARDELRAMRAEVQSLRRTLSV